MKLFWGSKKVKKKSERWFHFTRFPAPIAALINISISNASGLTTQTCPKLKFKREQASHLACSKTSTHQTREFLIRFTQTKIRIAKTSMHGDIIIIVWRNETRLDVSSEQAKQWGWKKFSFARDLRRMFTYLRNHRRKKNKKLKRKLGQILTHKGKLSRLPFTSFSLRNRESHFWWNVSQKDLFSAMPFNSRNSQNFLKWTGWKTKKNAAETSTEFDIEWGRMCRRQTGAGRRQWMYTQRNAISRCR